MSAASSSSRSASGPANPSAFVAKKTGRTTGGADGSEARAWSSICGVPWAIGQVYVPAAPCDGRLMNAGAKSASSGAASGAASGSWVRPWAILTGAQAPGAAQRRSPRASVSTVGRSTSTSAPRAARKAAKKGSVSIR